MLQLRFLGGAGTVTGSRFLLTTGRRRLLVECGLFQGYKHLRERNRAPLPVSPGRLDGVVFTHSHLDHTGWFPRLVQEGFTGKAWCTRATRDLLGLLLPDAGFLQEEEAAYANRKGFSRHHPAEPLYTQADAMTALEHLRACDFDEQQHVAGFAVRFLPAGHILGAAIVEVEADGRRVVFSGDLGRAHDPVMYPPRRVSRADCLVLESTYGDRTHPDADPQEVLGEVIRRTYARGGTVVVPTFAVGRAQSLLYHLWRLRRDERAPPLPVFLDSPMAIDATGLFERHHGLHRLDGPTTREVCRLATLVNTAEQSKAVDRLKAPKIILSASGMATGGRVVHHIKAFGPDPRSTLLFAGFQAGGTRGADLVAGARTVKIHGHQVSIRAEVAQLDMMSAHADADGLLDWLSAFERPPGMTYLVHGEPKASDALRRRIQDQLGWPVRVPEHQDRVQVATPRPGAEATA